MRKPHRLVEKMKANPCDWRIQQLETVARHYQVSIRKTGGNHVVFDHLNWVEMLSVPAARPIKPIYIKRFLWLLSLLEDEND